MWVNRVFLALHTQIIESNKEHLYSVLKPHGFGLLEITTIDEDPKEIFPGKLLHVSPIEMFRLLKYYGVESSGRTRDVSPLGSMKQLVIFLNNLQSLGGEARGDFK